MSTRPSRGRVLRRLRQVVVVLLGVLVLLNVASLVYNAASRPADTFTAPDGADVTVDGRRVHYRQWGSTGPDIVLVHGFAEHTASWVPMADELAKTHRVTAVDLAGYGYTAYDGRYSLDDQVALVSGVIEGLHLDRPVLVGHSLGAGVVGGVALAHPELVRGVIFADGDALPFGDPEADTNRGGGWFLRLPTSVSAYRIATRWSWLDERIVKRVCGSQCEGITPEIVEAWLRPMRQGAAERAFMNWASSPMVALHPAQVRAITVPRAIIWGSEDESGGGSLSGAQENLGHPPTMIIQGAGHLSMLAKPVEFAHDVATLADAMR